MSNQTVKTNTKEQEKDIQNIKDILKDDLVSIELLYEHTVIRQYTVKTNLYVYIDGKFKNKFDVIGISTNRYDYQDPAFDGLKLYLQGVN